MSIISVIHLLQIKYNNIDNEMDNSYRVRYVIIYDLPQMNLGVIHRKLLQSFKLVITYFFD